MGFHRIPALVRESENFDDLHDYCLVCSQVQDLSLTYLPSLASSALVFERSQAAGSEEKVEYFCESCQTSLCWKSTLGRCYFPGLGWATARVSFDFQITCTHYCCRTGFEKSFRKSCGLPIKTTRCNLSSGLNFEVLELVIQRSVTSPFDCDFQPQSSRNWDCFHWERLWVHLKSSLCPCTTSSTGCGLRLC
jgi:hypothetical protein